MKILFRILFTVNISHTYYNAACRDFDFIIPPDTVTAMKNARLLARVREGKLYVLYEGAENGDAIVPAAGTSLRFGLKLLNPYFSNITDLAFISGAATPFYKNAAVADVLSAPEEAVLVGRLFSHSLTGTERPVTVTLKNAGGQILQTDTVTAAHTRATVSYDLTGQAAGTYTVEEVYPGDSETIPYYSDTDLQQTGAFGIVEIGIGSGFYSVPPAFEIAFNAKKEMLKYYVVAVNYSENDFGQLTVRDNGFSEDQRPQVSFTRVASDAFAADDISPVLLGGSDARVALFKSQETVERREKARKKIQLNKNGDVLIAHLPQPGVDRFDGNLIINISKNTGG